MVMDMGQHVVHDYDQPLTLHQVMVPGLEDRARSFPALTTARQLSPGTTPTPHLAQICKFAQYCQLFRVSALS